MATSYQALLQDSTSPVRRIPLTGAQEGFVLTVTSQDYIVHWSGSISEDGNTGLVDAMIVLPYQEGYSIYNAEASTEILNNFNSTETGTNDEAICTREVFIVHRSQSPLIPLEQPDVRSSDESESNISPDAQGDDSEAESQRQVRERKNKLKQGRRCQAKQRKEAWARYESDLAKYNKRRAARKTHNSPYAKIRELVEEYEAISHPNEEQERL
jgi:hypothetical protein